jgi:hypothetical protein
MSASRATRSNRVAPAFNQSPAALQTSSRVADAMNKNTKRRNANESGLFLKARDLR